MKTRLTSLFALLLAFAAPAALAQQPLDSAAITEIDVAGGSTYGGGTATPVNGGNGPYMDQVTIWGLATGTNPAGGYTYAFYVNGTEIGTAINVPAGGAGNGTQQGVSWTPSEPGVYYFSVTATGGAQVATSLPVEYFATGIKIVSPVANVILPVGSSVVIQAAAAINEGAVSKVNFYADNALIGTATNYPYSIIYTPAGPVGTVHFIYARSYLADGTTVANTATDQGIVMVAPVGPIPTCVISTPTGNPTTPSVVPIPDYLADADASIPIIVNAGSPTGTITEVQLYINGVLFGTDTGLPYTFEWKPTVTGTYNFTALAYDAKNNVIASTTSLTASITPQPTTVIVGSLPSVAITSPGNGGTLNGGGTSTITASATDTNTDANGNPIAITQVQFFQDGSFVGVATQPTTPGGNSYTVSFTPTQKLDPTTGAPEDSQLTAIATDFLGFTGTSPAVVVNVTEGGTGGSIVIGTPPTISITAPLNQADVVVNTPITLSATAAAPNGNPVAVTFLVDNTVLSTASQYPYSVVWTPRNLGTYTILAQVTDNVGDKTNSQSITVNVVQEPPPVVSISSPTAGGIITVGTPVTITAGASSPTGTVSQVQFYENGILIGTSTTPPYSIQFTPQSTGIFTLTAIATDNSGEVTTSSTVDVEAAPVSSGVGTTIYTGNYQGLTDSGYFALVTPDGVTATYIGFPTTGLGAGNPIQFITGIPLTSQGQFSTSAINGTATTMGVSGSLTPSGNIFIGGLPSSTGNTATNATGYYTGNVQGQPTSQVAIIAASDGSIFVYVSAGTFMDVGFGSYGSVGTSGAFSISTAGNNTISGTINPTTGFVTATLTGGPGGVILAGKVSGGTFSDGVLKNISTRGDVGTGANIMIAGFVVGGSAPKQLLVRAIGPGLTGLGLQGAISGTQLQVFSGSSLIASNTGWSSTTVNAAQVTAADTAAGAFPLTAGSADSALVASFVPGAYTAMVSGVGGVTGIGLVEVYDLDAFSPFTTNKLVNVSTRGDVGTGPDVLIGGFVINGTSPKRLLIRGAGPGLTAMGVAGALATPRLQLFNSAGTVIRENYSWQDGNDEGLLAAAEASTGAFAFAKGSSDAAILIVLPPGTYTAQVSGANGATGVALVEIYEVP
jgi:hypothetical protein